MTRAGRSGGKLSEEQPGTDHGFLASTRENRGLSPIIQRPPVVAHSIVERARATTSVALTNAGRANVHALV